jgi:alkylhydroperoxidase family enzyme
VSTFIERSLPIEDVPSVLVQHVHNLEAAGVDTAFHRYMAHSHKACDFYWGRFYADFFNQTTVSRRDIEVTRLRLAAQSGCSFCRAHDIASALACGVNQTTIDALFESASEPSAIPALDDHDRTLAELADSISPFTPMFPMSESLRQALQNMYSDEEIAEVLMVTGVLAGIGAMLVAAGFVPFECEI